MNNDSKILYSQALTKWGFEPQLNQLQEECAELIVACNKLRRKGEEARPLMIDELADVVIMTQQIIYAMEVENEVEERINFKLNRIGERLGTH
jgi:NTP pyrophosphatase (non-canonical NTP hydrolase)